MNVILQQRNLLWTLFMLYNSVQDHILHLNQANSSKLLLSTAVLQLQL
jgi:hypothetical protein